MPCFGRARSSRMPRTSTHRERDKESPDSGARQEARQDPDARDHHGCLRRRPRDGEGRAQERDGCERIRSRRRNSSAPSDVQPPRSGGEGAACSGSRCSNRRLERLDGAALRRSRARDRDREASPRRRSRARREGQVWKYASAARDPATRRVFVRRGAGVDRLAAACRQRRDAQSRACTSRRTATQAALAPGNARRKEWRVRSAIRLS